jgi:hypothetical protein
MAGIISDTDQIEKCNIVAREEAQETNITPSKQLGEER